MRMWMVSVLLMGCAQTSVPDMREVLDINFSGDFTTPLDFAIEDQSVGDIGPPDEATPFVQCDMSTPDGGGTVELFVAAATSSGAPYAAVHDDNGWTALSAGGSGIATMSAVAYDGVPTVVAQLTSNSLVASFDDTCVKALPTPGELFANALTASRPAAIGGSAIDVVFRGSLNGDQRLFATTYDGTWSAATALGNFLSILPPAAVRVGGDVHVLFTGTDTNIYDGTVNTSGGSATAITLATSNAGPVAVVTSDGTTHVVFQGTDTNIYWAARPSAGSYASPASLCTGQTNCLIASDEPPVVTIDASGAPVVAWVGKDGIVYTTRLGGSQWSAALAATAETTALLPAMSAGLPGNDLEVVYVRSSDGQLRHVSEMSGVFGVAESLPGGVIATPPSVVLFTAP